MRRKVTGRIPSLLAVRCHGRIQAAGSDACPGHRALAPGRIGRLSRPHRGAPPVSIYAALIGRRPNRYGRAHTQAAERIPRPHRELSRYLCKLRDWAQAQSYAAGLPAVCHKWSGALPPQAYATTRHSPRLGHTPRPSVANVSAFNANTTSQAFTRFAQLVWPHGYCWYPPKIKNNVCHGLPPAFKYVSLLCYFHCSRGCYKEAKRGRDRERAKSETTKPSCYAFDPVSPPVPHIADSSCCAISHVGLCTGATAAVLIL